MDCRYATIHPAPGASRRGSFPVHTGYAGYVKEQYCKSVIGQRQSEIGNSDAPPCRTEGGLVVRMRDGTTLAHMGFNVNT